MYALVRMNYALRTLRNHGSEQIKARTYVSASDCAGGHDTTAPALGGAVHDSLGLDVTHGAVGLGGTPEAEVILKY